MSTSPRARLTQSSVRSGFPPLFPSLTQTYTQTHAHTHVYVHGVRVRLPVHLYLCLCPPPPRLRFSLFTRLRARLALHRLASLTPFARSWVPTLLLSPASLSPHSPHIAVPARVCVCVCWCAGVTASRCAAPPPPLHPLRPRSNLRTCFACQVLLYPLPSVAFSPLSLRLISHHVLCVFTPVRVCVCACVRECALVLLSLFRFFPSSFLCSSASLLRAAACSRLCPRTSPPLVSPPAVWLTRPVRFSSLSFPPLFPKPGASTRHTLRFSSSPLRSRVCVAPLELSSRRLCAPPPSRALVFSALVGLPINACRDSRAVVFSSPPFV